MFNIQESLAALKLLNLDPKSGDILQLAEALRKDLAGAEGGEISLIHVIKPYI